MAKERIGLMGGSFNPIHHRHLELAVCAMREAKLSRVFFVPTGNPPHKHEGLAPAEQRYEMTRLATLRFSGFEATRVELDRPGIIYTLDTLLQLKKQYKDADFDYIIGEDTMLDLPNWHRPDEVFPLCRFLVFSRLTSAPENQPVRKELEARGAKFAFLTLPALNVSSTEIRAKLGTGEPVPEMPEQVLEYIRIMGLYGTGSPLPKAEERYARLRIQLSDKRLVHSLLVSYTARRLAQIHHEDPQRAALAGLLPDCAKCMPLAQMQKVARDARLLVDKETFASDNLLHSAVGAWMAEHDYGVTDERVLSAIRCHTTGRVGMLPMDMILFLADKIEPSRKPYPALEELRLLAEKSLVKAMVFSLESTLAYVKSGKNAVHPTTQKVAEWLGRLTQE